MSYIYNALDVIITLRCNASCKNCIKFCNMQFVTGLDYSDSDMTISQIKNFINQVYTLGRKPVFNILCITGGEPLLHPFFNDIFLQLKKIYDEGYCNRLVINSNKIIDAPIYAKQFIVNYSLPKENKNIHNVSLLHPIDYGGKEQTYKSCYHHRKNTVVLNYQGYSMCCAGDGQIRLFNREDLILYELPPSPEGFPLDKMDEICKNCPFGDSNKLPLEKDLGTPVSNIYKIEADKNKAGRKITKRFPGI